MDDLYVDLQERELVEVELHVVDILTGTSRNITDLEDVNVINVSEGQILVYENGYWSNKDLNATVDIDIVSNETPSPVSALPSARFSTANDYMADSLQVFLNGMKIHTSEITQHNDTEFSLPLDVLSEDKIEVSYIKK